MTSTARSGSERGPKTMAVKTGRIEKNTSKRKRERPGAAKRAQQVEKPLSELLHEFPPFEMPDIAKYVHRAKEERLREVAECKPPGRIKRPMNAFMLYRKAYQNLAKSICTQNNHQIVSQVCGDAWPLEPEHIREQFNEWAKIEKENHIKAHPNYKFTPSKPAKKVRKVDTGSDEGSHLGEAEWASERPLRGLDAEKAARQTQMGAPVSTPISIFETYDGYGSLGVPSNHSLYPYSNTGKLIPTPYDSTGFPGDHYYQQSVYSTPGQSGLVEDVVIRKTPSPASFGQPHHIMGDTAYPPIIDPYATMGMGSEHTMDPSLVARPSGKAYDGTLDNFGFDVDPKWLPSGMTDIGPLGMHESMEPLDAFLEQDPQLQYLKGEEGSWQVEEVPPRSQSEAWQG